MKAALRPATTPSAGRRLGPVSRPIEDQQLVLDEHGYGHHGTAPPSAASRATVAGSCKKERPHRAPHDPTNIVEPRIAQRFRNSPCTGTISSSRPELTASVQGNGSPITRF